MNGSRSELLLKCEVNCVFLLLILRPSPQKIVPELTKILEKYTWGEKNDPILKGMSLILLRFCKLINIIASKVCNIYYEYYF